MLALGYPRLQDALQELYPFWHFAEIIVLAAAFLVSFTLYRTILNPFAILLASAVAIFVISGVNIYGLQKFFSGYISPFLLAFILSRVVKSPEVFFKGLTFAIIAFFLFAVIKKAGLPDPFLGRSEYYGIFGPITFGWLMGLGVILVFFGRYKYAPLFYVLFAFGVFWSMSKGPLIALVLTAIVYAIRRRGLGENLILYFFVLFGGVLALNYLSEYRVVSNFAATFSNGDSPDSVRAYFYSTTIQQIFQSPLFGGGVGHWSEFTGISSHFYVHNSILEIISEGGIFLFLAFSFFVIFSLRGASDSCRYIFIFFFFALLFSGDLSYHRYITFILFFENINRTARADSLYKSYPLR